jgi:prepilin-type processing-associated H-X9-DG protein
LAAILFPVFARAREKARQTTCTSNQRQIAASVMMYSQDHEETLPNTATVWSDIKVDPAVLVCPTLGKSSPIGYGYNGNVAGIAVGQLAEPNAICVSIDAVAGLAGNLAYTPDNVDTRHSGSAIISYADGHVNVASDVFFICKGTENLLATVGSNGTGGGWTNAWGSVNANTYTTYANGVYEQNGYGDGNWCWAKCTLSDRSPQIYWSLFGSVQFLRGNCYDSGSTPYGGGSGNIGLFDENDKAICWFRRECSGNYGERWDYLMMANATTIDGGNAERVRASAYYTPKIDSWYNNYGWPMVPTGQTEQYYYTPDPIQTITDKVYQPFIFLATASGITFKYAKYTWKGAVISGSNWKKPKYLRFGNSYYYFWHKTDMKNLYFGYK